MKTYITKPQTEDFICFFFAFLNTKISKEVKGEDEAM